MKFFHFFVDGYFWASITGYWVGFFVKWWLGRIGKKHRGNTLFSKFSSDSDAMADALVHAEYDVDDNGYLIVIGYSSHIDPEIHDTLREAVAETKKILMEVEK